MAGEDMTLLSELVEFFLSMGVVEEGLGARGWPIEPDARRCDLGGGVAMAGRIEPLGDVDTVKFIEFFLDKVGCSYEAMFVRCNGMTCL